MFFDSHILTHRTLSQHAVIQLSTINYPVTSLKIQRKHFQWKWHELWHVWALIQLKLSAHTTFQIWLPITFFSKIKCKKSYFDIVNNNKFTPTIVHKRTTRYSVCFLKSCPHKLWFTVSAVIRFILYKNYGEALFWEQKSTWWSWDKKI